MKFSELLQKLGNDAEINSFKPQKNPELNPEIQGVAAINEAYSGSLSFVDREKFIAEVENTSASVLILPLNEELQQKANEREIAWIATAQPRLLFAKTIALFYTPYTPSSKIHPTAVIDPSAQLGENVSVSAHVVIEAGVKIGDDVCIFPNVVIYPEVEIGNRTILHANCTIHERSRLGQDCVIQSGAVIGAEGFGFVPIPEGWYKMPQSGYVVLEDGVEVGCSSAIDRPSVGETRIGRNTKIDNLVQIAHGCKIGENCAIAGQVGMAGAVKIGNRVILAGQVGITDGTKIGDGAIATAKAGIHNDIEPGAVVTGIPAISHKLFLKATAVYNRLPEMYKTLKQLKKQIEDKT